MILTLLNDNNNIMAKYSIMARHAKWAEYCKSLQYIEETNFGKCPTAGNNDRYEHSRIMGIYPAEVDDPRVFITCANCKKLFHIEPDLRGEFERGGLWECLWECDKCKKPKETHNLFVGPVIASITPNDNKPRIVNKYKRVESPDVYAVQYDTGNIIKTAVEDHKTEEFEYACGIPDHGDNCTRRFPLKDLRELDNKGELDKYYKPRKYPKQIR